MPPSQPPTQLKDQIDSLELVLSSSLSLAIAFTALSLPSFVLSLSPVDSDVCDPDGDDESEMDICRLVCSSMKRE